MILLVEHYVPSDPLRVAELAKTVTANDRLGIFDEFVPLKATGDRLTYGEVFRHCAALYRGRVCVLANTDIEFTESALLLPALVKPKTLVTLTRWENDSTPRMIGHLKGERFFSGSQDVWAFIGGELVGVGDQIPLGYIGCDQAIAGEAMKACYEVVNPALSIKTLHNHANGERRPDELSVVGTYAYPELTTLRVTGQLVHHEWPQV